MLYFNSKGLNLQKQKGEKMWEKTLETIFKGVKEESIPDFIGDYNF